MIVQPETASPIIEGTRYISAQEGAEMFDRAARELLNMSGDEFTRMFESGQIPDPHRPEVIRVSMLMRYAEG